MTTGECMQLSRERAGMSLKELSACSGIADPLISRYERGVTTPTLTTVELLADALGISIDEYVGHTPVGDSLPSAEAMTPRQKEWAYQKWCLGYTSAHIAEALDLSHKTVQRALRGRPRVRPMLVYDED